MNVKFLAWKANMIVMGGEQTPLSKMVGDTQGIVRVDDVALKVLK